MASSTIKNGGGETSGIKPAFNAPIKQRPALRFMTRSSSSVAGAYAVNINGIPLPVLHSVAPTPPFTIFSPCSRGLMTSRCGADAAEHYDYDIQMRPLPPTSDNPSNQGLPDFEYLAASDHLLDTYTELTEFTKDIAAGVTSRGTLNASTASQLDHLNKYLFDVCSNQLHMQVKQQSYGDSLDAELHGIILRKEVYITIFTFLAALFGAGAYVAAKVHPVSLAMSVGGFAAAASVVSLAAAKRMDSHQDELMIPVKKRKNISEAITGAIKLSLGHLEDIMASASDLQFHAESVLEIVDSGAGIESNVVTTDIAAFQKLETKVERCRMDAYSVRQATILNITTNSGSGKTI